MSTIIVTYQKFSNMAAETKSTAAAYRKLIARMKSEVVGGLSGMSEPSLKVGIGRMNDVIREMEQTAANLEKISSDLQSALNAWKRTQEAIANAAQNLKH